jgi:hypothetical protein
MLQDKSIIAHDLRTHFEGDLVCTEPKVTTTKLVRGSELLVERSLLYTDLRK